MKVKSLSHVPLFATPWTVAYQAPPSREFSRQEYWCGVPCLLGNNRLVGINSRKTEAEEQINDLEDKMVEITATEQNIEKRMKK